MLPPNAYLSRSTSTFYVFFLIFIIIVIFNCIILFLLGVGDRNTVIPIKVSVPVYCSYKVNCIIYFDKKRIHLHVNDLFTITCTDTFIR